MAKPWKCRLRLHDWTIENPETTSTTKCVCAVMRTEKEGVLTQVRVRQAEWAVLKRPRRGQPLTAAGLDEVPQGARDRAGLAHASCHELRHTCLTRLREAGMALEAVQAQAGHASI